MTSGDGADSTATSTGLASNNHSHSNRPPAYSSAQHSAYESVPAVADDDYDNHSGHRHITTTTTVAAAAAVTQPMLATTAAQQHIRSTAIEMDGDDDHHNDDHQDNDDDDDDQRPLVPIAASAKLHSSQEEDGDNDDLERLSFRLAATTATTIAAAQRLTTTTTTATTQRLTNYSASETSLDESHGSSASASSRSRPPTDGVFANLSAKPEKPAMVAAAGAGGAPGADTATGHHHGPAAEQQAHEEALPAYAAIADDSVPPYPVVIVNSFGETEPLVDGLPLGTFFGFFLAFLVTFTFQVVGFVVSYLASTSHSSRLGARSGMGLVLINYGMVLRGHSARYEYDAQVGYYKERPSDAGTTDEDSPGSLWLSYALMIVGWFTILQATNEYFRLRKTRQVLLMSMPASAVVAGAATNANTNSGSMEEV